MTAFPSKFQIESGLLQKMLGHISDCLPEEACGVIGGFWTEGGAVAQLVFPVENEMHSPTRFRMAPADQLESFKVLERHNLELVAIYHSHPAGPDQPSATDRAEFAYPGVLSIIVSPLTLEQAGESDALRQQWQVRAFRIDGVLTAEAGVVEVPVEITQFPGSHPDSR